MYKYLTSRPSKFSKKAHIALLFIAFSLLFWHQKEGVNYLLYSLLIAFYSIRFHPYQQSKNSWIALGLTLTSCIAILISNSTLAMWSWFLSLLSYLGFVHYPQLRTLFGASLTTIMGFIYRPFYFIETRVGTTMNQQINKEVNPSPKKRTGLILIIPIVMLVLFYIIYLISNDYFLELNYRLFNSIFQFLARYLDITFLPFLLLAVISTVVVVNPNPFGAYADFEIAQRLRIQRRNGKQPTASTIPFTSNQGTALQVEYKSSVLMFILLNLLLFINNLSDINGIFFSSTSIHGYGLSYFVHKGTYILIFSILLSAVLVIVTLRQNLNFHPKAKTIRSLSTLWLGQNLLLVVSVAIRNYDYVSQYGLTAKRISVFIFLLFCAIGLAFMFIKIFRKDSLFSLLKNNVLWMGSILVCLSIFPWTKLILHYNLNAIKSENIDVDYLYSLGSKSYPALLQKMDTLQFNDLNTENELHYRAKNFIYDYESKDWRSWNWSDQQTYKALKGANLKNSIYPVDTEVSQKTKPIEISTTNQGLTP